MLELETRDQRLEIRIFVILFLAFRACGVAVQSLRKVLGKSLRAIHINHVTGFGVAHKRLVLPRLFTQTALFLYTVYRQQFSNFQSVLEGFVHTIHSAYKEPCTFKKMNLLMKHLEILEETRAYALLKNTSLSNKHNQERILTA